MKQKEKREYFRGKGGFSVGLEDLDTGKQYEVRTIDISGGGILVAGDDINIPKGTLVVLDFQLPHAEYILPLMKGAVARVDDTENGYELGIEFDYFDKKNPFIRRDSRTRRQDEADRDKIINYASRKGFEALKRKKVREAYGDVE